jgi:hypothetical protein
MLDAFNLFEDINEPFYNAWFTPTLQEIILFRSL